MTVVPGAPHTLTLVCDKCGQTVPDIECAAEHWSIVWAVIGRSGWSGSPVAIGPHYCPRCVASSSLGKIAGGSIPPGPDWGATLSDHSNACVLRLRGHLDVLATGLRDALAEAMGRHRNLVLDLRAVRLLDSTGLVQLVHARDLSRGRGGDLCLVAPSEDIQAVLQTMRLDAAFPTFSDIAGALAWLGRPGGDAG